MSDDSRLRDKARDAARAGAMPNRRPDRTWGGPGVGADCAVCGLPVNRGDLELEIEFTADDGEGENYHVHTRCFALWESERRNLDGRQAG